MASPIGFETPENVRLAYETAGLGTRFSAWLLDTLFVTVVTILLAILLIVIGAMAGVVLRDIDTALDESHRSGHPDVLFYLMGILFILFQFGSFLYFTLCELFWEGRTIGKRKMKVQVVKVDGFALDAGSVVLRNIFRLVDQIPALWIVPVLSPRSQRFGDMAAGSIVVSTAQSKLSDLRTRLLSRPAADARFRFDGTMLGGATPTDIQAAEQLIERWPQLRTAQQSHLLGLIVEPLARRLRAEPPEPSQRQEFIEDFLAAVYRREAQRLG